MVGQSIGTTPTTLVLMTKHAHNAVECTLNFILNCYRAFFTFTIVLLLYAEIRQSIVKELRVEGLNYLDPESAVLRSQNRKLSMICC